MGLLGHVAQAALESDQVVADILPSSSTLPALGSMRASDDLDGGRFARAVGAEVAGDLARLHA